MNLRTLICGAGVVFAAFLMRAVGAPGPSSSAPSYTVRDLGTLPGGTFSQTYVIGDNELIGGAAAVSDGSQHAILWHKGQKLDIGAPGLGGPNSGVFGVNEFFLAEGVAETSHKDPNQENFCAYGTGFTCLPFVWQAGRTFALPSLGGPNASVGNMNRWGAISGYAETDQVDSSCLTAVSVGGTGPQVLDYQGVIWGPAPGAIRRLKPLPGDTVSVALWVNDLGQAVGVSGTCANTVLPPIAFGPHAVLWERDGSVHDLGNLGGTVDVTIPGIGNAALAINNLSEVVGGSALPGNTLHHGFLWTRKSGIKDLGTLPDDATSVGTGINDHGTIAGVSLDGSGNPRAVIWYKGGIHDLNDLAQDSPLFLLWSSAINGSDEIAGFGVDPNTGDVHAFLAKPDGNDCDDAPGRKPKALLADWICRRVREQIRFLSR
ncbi:MAG: hypothetical protein WA324_11330 [Bryobacteraceae bacterium]